MDGPAKKALKPSECLANHSAFIFPKTNTDVFVYFLVTYFQIVYVCKSEGFDQFSFYVVKSRVIFLKLQSKRSVIYKTTSKATRPTEQRSQNTIQNKFKQS